MALYGPFSILLSFYEILKTCELQHKFMQIEVKILNNNNNNNNNNNMKASPLVATHADNYVKKYQ